MINNRQFCDTLEKAIDIGSLALATSKTLQRVLFMPADTDAARTGEDVCAPDTLVIHCRDLIWPNWYVITRDIGLGGLDLNEHTLLNAMLEIERIKMVGVP